MPFVWILLCSADGLPHHLSRLYGAWLGQVLVAGLSSTLPGPIKWQQTTIPFTRCWRHHCRCLKWIVVCGLTLFCFRRPTGLQVAYPPTLSLSSWPSANLLVLIPDCVHQTPIASPPPPHTHCLATWLAAHCSLPTLAHLPLPLCCHAAHLSANTNTTCHFLP